ncbi:YkgJ family cysteine cluster protein [Pelagicoccus mobilis]|uniref:YkgJ family cysteine cluster protein n=1 Tax=Pelagicoccus mobilis TaxID=415221 RepID=A0A934RXT5_9BACT|nr:YkgJ family cysteine cluster protein [Pelagicoccus mobilis]MBK1876796.1 YkgJ family cysteine cluster protein [Pelagicoccus mobilis]
MPCDSRKVSASKEAFDCTACGACCRCFPIFAGEADAQREPRIREEARLLEAHMRSEERSYRLFPLPFLDCCPFLRENLLCRIYESRPRVCRRFEVGSDQCLEARRRIGIVDAI